MKQPVLKSERLRLRNFELQDSSQVQKLAGNINVAKTTLNIPHPYNDGMAEEWIKSHKVLWESRAQLIYAITKLDTKQLVGAVSLVGISGDQAELGYWIGEPYWNKGYCTEAARALVTFSFSKLGLNTLFAEHLASNPASGKVMKNIGMSYSMSKTLKNRFNDYVDVEVYELQNT